jgi:pimeloyl-ACP methyl ester carboxylesterase
VAGCGYGAHPDARESFRAESQAIANAFQGQGAAAVAPTYGTGPARVQFQNKDRRGWEEFVRQLAGHSSEGSALTMRGVQRERPSLDDLTDQLRALEVPTLLLVGDEDEGCLEANLMLKRTIPAAGLAVLPRTGHTLNLEEPELFNRLVGDFLATVDAGRWGLRDPRSVSTTLTGISG